MSFMAPLAAAVTQIDDTVLLALNRMMGQHPAWDLLLKRLLDFDQLKFGLPIYGMVALWFRAGPGQADRRRILRQHAVRRVCGPRARPRAGAVSAIP